MAPEVGFIYASFKEVANLLGDCQDLFCVRSRVRDLCDNFRANHVAFARRRFLQKERRKDVLNPALLWMLRFEKLLGEGHFGVYQRQLFRQHIEPLFLYRRCDVRLQTLQLSEDKLLY